MKKKGYKAQAALEFLTTYGWALLLITIMIGAIVYFGVVRPKHVIREQCITSNYPFECEDFTLSPDGLFNVKLRWVGEGNLTKIYNLTWKCDDKRAHIANGSLPIINSSSSSEVINIQCDMGTLYGRVEPVRIDLTLEWFSKNGFKHKQDATIIVRTTIN